MRLHVPKSRLAFACNLLALVCTCLHLPCLAFCIPPLGKEKPLRIEISFIINYHLLALLHFNPIINSFSLEATLESPCTHFTAIPQLLLIISFSHTDKVFPLHLPIIRLPLRCHRHSQLTFISPPFFSLFNPLYD